MTPTFGKLRSHGASGSILFSETMLALLARFWSYFPGVKWRARYSREFYTISLCKVQQLLNEPNNPRRYITNFLAESNQSSRAC